jgi:hypothetical protein
MKPGIFIKEKNLSSSITGAKKPQIVVKERDKSKKS